jgi:hypothetical protein
MTDLDAIFAKIAGLIEAAEKSHQDGRFYLEVPTLEWEAAEASLDRTPADRKFMARVFKWRGVYVVRGGKWFINASDSAMTAGMAPPVRRGTLRSGAVAGVSDTQKERACK